LDFDGYKRTVGAGVVVVDKTVWRVTFWISVSICTFVRVKLVNCVHKRTVGAGVVVVEKNVECDILDGVRLDDDQEIEEQRVSRLRPHTLVA
jgi:hypothetical protein